VTQRPPAILGLRHVALNAHDLAACEAFYVELLGVQVEWRPDPQKLYLSGGPDNLALHQAAPGERDAAAQRLDHIGFCLASAEAVDAWYAFLQRQGVRMRNAPRTGPVASTVTIRTARWCHPPVIE